MAANARSLALAMSLVLAPLAQAGPLATTPPRPTEGATNDAAARESGPPNQEADRTEAASPAAPAPAAPAPAPAPAAATAAPPPAPVTGPGGGTKHECPLSLDAAPLLREAAVRGIQPKVVAGTSCDINPADNEFFGRGGSVGCKLQFTNARWLGEGIRFTDITGVGNFEARVSSSGLEVSIPADGGVRFRRVSVQASVRASASCPAPRPENVLAD